MATSFDDQIDSIIRMHGSCHCTNLVTPGTIHTLYYPWLMWWMHGIRHHADRIFCVPSMLRNPKMYGWCHPSCGSQCANGMIQDTVMHRLPSCNDLKVEITWWCHGLFPIYIGMPIWYRIIHDRKAMIVQSRCVVKNIILSLSCPSWFTDSIIHKWHDTNHILYHDMFIHNVSITWSALHGWHIMRYFQRQRSMDQYILPHRLHHNGTMDVIICDMCFAHDDPSSVNRIHYIDGIVMNTRTTHL